MSTVHNAVVQYIVTQASKNFRSCERLAAKKEPLTAFKKTMQSSLKILKLSLAKTMPVHSENRLNEFTTQCRQFKKFTEDCEALEELGRDLQGAVTALEQMKKTDETAAKVIGEIIQKKELVEKLNMSMQELHHQTAQLIKQYEQTMPHKRGDGSTKLERQDTTRSDQEKTRTPIVEDQEWETVELEDLTTITPVINYPATFRSFTIKSPDTFSLLSSFSSSSSSSGMRTDIDSSKEESHNFDVGNTVSTSVASASNDPDLGASPPTARSSTPVRTHPAVVTPIILTAASTFSSSSSSSSSIVPNITRDCIDSAQNLDVRQGMLNNANTSSLSSIPLKTPTLLSLQNSRSCDTFNWLLTCRSRSKENKQGRSQSASDLTKT